MLLDCSIAHPNWRGHWESSAPQLESPILYSLWKFGLSDLLHVKHNSLGNSQWRTCSPRQHQLPGPSIHPAPFNRDHHQSGGFTDWSLLWFLMAKAMGKDNKHPVKTISLLTSLGAWLNLNSGFSQPSELAASVLFSLAAWANSWVLETTHMGKTCPAVWLAWGMAGQCSRTGIFHQRCWPWHCCQEQPVTYDVD